MKYSSQQSILFHSNDMTETTQPLEVNTLRNVLVIDLYIQLIIALYAVIIVHSHWTEDLRLDFSLEYF